MAGRSKHCHECGELVDAGGDVCEDCGAWIASSPSSATSGKSAGVAAVLSLLATGMGQVYLDRPFRGVAWIVSAIAFVLVAFFFPAAFLPWALFVIPLFPVASAVDAFLVGEDPTPEGMKSPGVAVFLALLVVGMGHVYIDRLARGLGWLFGGILLALVVTSAPQFPGFLLWFVPVASAIDAYLLAEGL